MENQTKSFLQRPEGKTGLIVGGLLLAAGAYGTYFLLPFIITLLANALHAAVLCAVAAFIVYLIADSKFRTLVSYMYKIAMRALTGAVIVIDPIGILKGYVEDLEKRLEEMDKSIAALAGQIKRIKAIIEANREKRDHSLSLAKMAQQQQGKGQGTYRSAFILQSRQAGRLEKSNVTLQSLHDTMANLLKRLQKMREVSVFLMDDIKSEVEVKTQERAAIKAGYGAFTAAKRIMAGDADQKEMFDQAMESIAQDYALKLGEIEEFMDASDGFIKGVDLENMSFEADAMTELEKWDSKFDNMLENNARPGAGNAAQIRVADPSAGEADSAYDELFGPNSAKKKL